MVELLLNPAAYIEENFEWPEDAIWQHMLDCIEKQDLSEFPKVISRKVIDSNIPRHFMNILFRVCADNQYWNIAYICLNEAGLYYTVHKSEMRKKLP